MLARGGQAGVQRPKGGVLQRNILPAAPDPNLDGILRPEGDGLLGAVLEEKGGPRRGKSAFLQGEADFFAANKGEGAFAANLPWVPLPLRKEPGRNQEQKEEKSGKPFFHSSSLCQQRGEKVCHFSFCFFFFSCEKKKKWGCRGRSPCYTWISSIFLLSAKRFSSSLKR